MKLDVFDSKNPERLLGHLEVHSPIRGDRYDVSLFPKTVGSYADIYRSYPIPGELRLNRVSFNVAWRSKTDMTTAEWNRRRSVRDEWMVLETDVSLETLRELDRFFYPGEGKMSHNRRVNDY